MKRHARIRNLVLVAALIVAAGPAYPGGRDVPDTENSSASQTNSRSVPSASACATQRSDVQVGWIRFTIQVDVTGRPVVQPALFASVGRFMDRMFGSPPLAGRSCPER